jgi:hypothetical protein
METTTPERNAQTQPASSVRANVNERNFFASMKHLFASSFSVIGELLQNSRRAKATAVRITVDFDTKTLCVEDDGIGIDNFGKLLELSSSGWDQDTVLKETPFGMGFFSCFTSSERVEVRSKGRLLKASLKDVVNGRMIEILEIDDIQPSTTSVTLIGVNADVMDSSDSQKFTNKLKNLVKGFDLPVFINGEELERPHAMSKLAGEATSIGHVSIDGVHRGKIGPVHLSSVSDPTLYLQGLPIHASHYGYSSSTTVVHLDKGTFIAQMPDRKHLYDSEVQLKRVNQTLGEVLKAHLLHQKQIVPPMEFVSTYWSCAQDLGMLAIMNDLTVVPLSIFEQCDYAVIQTDYENACCNLDKDSRGYLCFDVEKFDSGIVKAIMDAPRSADDDAWASAMMKVMQREGIYRISSHLLDRGHWLFQKLVNYDKLSFQATPNGKSERQENYGWSDKETTVRLATSVEILVTTTSESGQEQEFLRHSVMNDWLMVPSDQSEEEYQDTACIVWLMGENCESGDHPVNALNTFYDEHETYREEWESEAKLVWATTVSNLRDLHMVKNVERIMRDQHLDIPAARAGEFGIVRIERNSIAEDAYGRPKLAFDQVDHEFMANLTTALQLQTGLKELDTTAVTKALLSVVQPDRYNGGPRNGDYIGQW